MLVTYVWFGFGHVLSLIRSVVQTHPKSFLLVSLNSQCPRAFKRLQREAIKLHKVVPARFLCFAYCFNGKGF